MLETLFFLIEKHLEIKEIEIFEYGLLYTVYTNDTTFFLKHSQSIAYAVALFNIFSFFQD